MNGMKMIPKFTPEDRTVNPGEVGSHLTSIKSTIDHYFSQNKQIENEKPTSPPANVEANPSKTSASAPSPSPNTGDTVTDSNPDLVNPPEGAREALTSSVPSDGKNDKADSNSTEEQSKGGEDNLEKASSVLEESLDVEASSITNGEINGIK